MKRDSTFVVLGIATVLTLVSGILIAADRN